MTDPIADMLTRIRNAILVNKIDVLIPCSKMKFEIAKILKQEGFIKQLEQVDKEGSGDHNSYIRLVLKYKNDESVIRDLKRVSKPGRKIYHGYHEIPKVLPSLGILIISTSHGLMTNTEARKQKIGGELICEIY